MLSKCLNINYKKRFHLLRPSKFSSSTPSPLSETSISSAPWSLSFISTKLINFYYFRSVCSYKVFTTIFAFEITLPDKGIPCQVWPTKSSHSFQKLGQSTATSLLSQTVQLRYSSQPAPRQLWKPRPCLNCLLAWGHRAANANHLCSMGHVPSLGAKGLHVN